MAEFSLCTRPRPEVKLDGKNTTSRDGRVSGDNFHVILDFSQRYRFEYSYLAAADDDEGPRLAKSVVKAAPDLRVPLDLRLIGGLGEGREAIVGAFEKWPIFPEERRQLAEHVLNETIVSLVSTRLPGGHNVIHVPFRATLVWESFASPPSTCTDMIM